jgi:hypothetical protein
MVKGERGIEMTRHNAPITRSNGLDHNAPITQTARPRIFFPAKDPTPPPWKKHPVISVFGEEFDMDLYASLDSALVAGHALFTPIRVREFTSDFWELPSRIKELEKETSEPDRRRIRALCMLRRAYYYFGEDEDSAREILKKVEELCAFREELSNEPAYTSNRGRVRILYPLMFGKALKHARVRMWPTDSGGFLPVIWCDNMTTAMFAYAAFKGVDTCQNCAKLFCTDLPRVDDSRSEKYCPVACGQRFRQRIYRKRQLEEAKGKSR